MQMWAAWRGKNPTMIGGEIHLPRAAAARCKFPVWGDELSVGEYIGTVDLTLVKNRKLVSILSGVSQSVVPLKGGEDL